MEPGDGKDGKKDKRLEYAESKDEEGYSGDDPKSGEKSGASRSQLQIFRFEWRWSIPKSASNKELEDFKTFHTEIVKLIKKEFPGAKFCFQLECTCREKEPFPEPLASLCKQPDFPQASLYNWHYQGWLKLKERKRPHTVGAILGKGGMQGISVRPASNAGAKALEDYVMKRDATYRAGPWADKWISAPYQGEDLITKLLPFQKYICDEIKKPPSNRVINWIYDPEGCSGKSAFVKMLTFKCPYFKYVDLADKKDACTDIVADGPKSFYIVDIPRTKTSKVSMDEMYMVVEQLKNGIVVQHKYEESKMVMKPPHVWVFSNWKPEKEKLTSDRLRVWSFNRETMDFDEDSKRVNAAKDAEAAATQAKFDALAKDSIPDF